MLTKFNTQDIIEAVVYFTVGLNSFMRIMTDMRYTRKSLEHSQVELKPPRALLESYYLERANSTWAHELTS